MYKDYWNLTERPFDNTVDERFFFYSKSHEEALIRLLYTISENKGFMVLTGDTGTGKTLLCEIVRRQLLAKGYQVSMVVNPNLKPEDFLRAVLRGMGVQQERMSKGELLWALDDFVQGLQLQNNACVVMIDEAQTITNPATLEEIRLMANLQHNSQHMVTTFLVGGKGLTEQLQKVPDLRYRIGVSFHLEPLSGEETGKYIRHRVATAGGQEPIFSDHAVEAVFACSGGVPREINFVCDAALLLGSGSGIRTIDTDTIREADAEARQLR